MTMRPTIRFMSRETSRRLTGMVLGLCLGTGSAVLAQQPQDPKSAAQAEQQQRIARSAESPEYSDPQASIKFVKPFPTWFVYNTGPETIHRISCSADINDEWSPKFNVLIMPGSAMPGGMELRRQIVSNVRGEGDRQIFHQVAFEKATFAGKEAVRLTYDLELEKPFRSVEYGLLNNGNFYIVQASAPIAEWEKADLNAAFEKSFASFAFLKPLTKK